MRELMTHTAGFSYGFFGDTPVDKMYRDANIFGSKDLHEFIVKISQLPLLYQPGKAWVYSASMDIQGYIVEKLSGQSLPDFMRDHIYLPLGMRDAGFYVPADKRSRFVTAYRNNAKGEMEASPNDGGPAGRSYDEQPTMPSGGGGTVSTAEDYYRFAAMLANGGELDGKRIARPVPSSLWVPTIRQPSCSPAPSASAISNVSWLWLRLRCPPLSIPPKGRLLDGKGGTPSSGNQVCWDTGSGARPHP